MWERIKTVTLTFLVMVSLLLTYVIWTSVPMSSPSEQPTVLSTVSYGSDKTVNDLVFPDQIVAHLGHSAHTVLYPDTTAYNMVLKELQKATIYDMKSVSYSNTDWKTSTESRSLELHFSWNIPFDVINLMFPGIKLIEPKPSCQTMIIQFDNNMQNNRILFITKGTDPSTYQARLGVPSDLFLSLFRYLEDKQPLYQMYGTSQSQSFYLPKDPMQLPVYTYHMDTLNLDQLTNTFFVDPSMTKKINERDGSYITTDGSRGVRFIPSVKHVQFTDPATDWKADQLQQIIQINKAITFSNEHGGIVGGSQLVLADPLLYGSSATYFIQSYMDGLPILDPVSQIRILMQGSQVVEFERPIQYVGEQISRVQKTILSGTKLVDMMQKVYNIPIQSVTQIKLVYQPRTIDKQQIELDPVYQITQAGNTQYVDAITGLSVDRRNKNGLE